MSWQQAYLNRFYSASRGWVDGTTEFHALCAAHIRRGSVILEIGAGPSNETSRYLSSLGPVWGVDVDSAVEANDALTEARVLTTDEYPFPDTSFDACVSDYVLEHLESPMAHFSEVARVLRPGGVYLFRTPSRYHYVTLVSRLTPHSFHRAVANRLRNRGADAHAPYPTHYRANSRRAIRRAAAHTGLWVRELRMVEKEPAYGMAAKPLFLGFMLYERVVNSSPRLAAFRANIFGVLERPSSVCGPGPFDATT